MHSFAGDRVQQRSALLRCFTGGPPWHVLAGGAGAGAGVGASAGRSSHDCARRRRYANARLHRRRGCHAAPHCKCAGRRRRHVLTRPPPPPRVPSHTTCLFAQRPRSRRCGTRRRSPKSSQRRSRSWTAATSPTLRARVSPWPGSRTLTPGGLWINTCDAAAGGGAAKRARIYTGLVHTAPAHGLDDYKLCWQHSIGVRHNYGAPTACTRTCRAGVAG